MMTRLSSIGLLVGAVFFAFSLTPSLLPRPFLIQGALSGVSLAAGYGLGVAGLALWNYLQLPLLRGRAALVAKVVVALISDRRCTDLPVAGLALAELDSCADGHGGARLEHTRR
jgi:uncharacterized membrane protein